MPHPDRSAVSRPRERAKGVGGRSSASSARSSMPRSATSSCVWRTTTRSATGSTPSSPRMEDVFLEVIDRIHSPWFGVQYDPSNAVVGGFDPIAFLEKVKHRVVTMHASDRYLVPGTTSTRFGRRRYRRIPRQAEARRDGQGDERLRRHLPHPGGQRVHGWISVEDGMNGLDELRRSVEFLKRKRGGLLRRPCGRQTRRRRPDRRSGPAVVTLAPTGASGSPGPGRSPRCRRPDEHVDALERFPIVFVEPGPIDRRPCRAAAPADLPAPPCPRRPSPRPALDVPIEQHERAVHGRPTHNGRGPGVPMTGMAEISTARPT